MEIVKTETDLSKSCGTCSHWSFGAKTKDGRAGECRFKPPTLHMMPVETLQGVAMTLQSQFPKIMESGWCSEHPARRLDKELDYSRRCREVIEKAHEVAIK